MLIVFSRPLATYHGRVLVVIRYYLDIMHIAEYMAYILPFSLRGWTWSFDYEATTWCKVFFLMLSGWTTCCLLSSTFATHPTGHISFKFCYRRIVLLYHILSLTYGCFLNNSCRCMMKWAYQMEFWGCSPKEDMVIITGIF